MILRAALIVLAGAAAAQDSALDTLTTAIAALDDAATARDRVYALTDAIRATETGLAAIRESQRQVVRRQQALTAKLAARDAETARFLGALQAMGRTDSPTLLLHPGGATGTARAAMLLAELGPTLNARAADLRAELTELQTLRDLQSASAQKVQTARTELHEAREALNTAIANRTDLPRRFRADPIREAILLSTTETLDAFASGLSQIVEEGSDSETPIDKPDIGALPMPALGVILREPGEADLAGVTRPGLLLATRPEALVTAPTAATIRYAGPLLDFGDTILLEPRAGSLIILAGLANTFASAGELVAKGAPLGLMGHSPQKSDTSTSTDGDVSGTVLSESLYIEVREDNAPVDPMLWFAPGPDKQDRE